MFQIESSLEVKKIFDSEVREKKKTGRGIFKQTGKRGYVGRVMTTMDFLTGKEKREYMKSGDLIMSNVYTSLLPFEDLITYSPESQKNILEQWRKVHTNKEIVDALGVNKNVYYKKVYDLGILERPESYKKNEPKKKRETNTTEKEARKENLISYKEFRALPKEEQYYLLDIYFNLYKTSSIASIWNRKASSLHQFRYTLKKYMTDNNLPLDDENERKRIEDKFEVHKEIPVVQNLMEFYGTEEKEEEEEEEKETLQESNTVDSSPSRDYGDELDALKKEIALMVHERDLEIQRLREEKESILKNNERENPNHFDSLDSLNYAYRRLNAPSQMGKTEVVNVENFNGMTFNYQEEKEGFLVHSDIQRFISMLEKNPDKFKVEMKIIRVDD